MPDARQLVDGWVNHFWSADHDVEWLDAEIETQTMLDKDTVLVGRIDAFGKTGKDLFFGEWKTSNTRDRLTWKQTWRLNPQSLTYGVLMNKLHPECHRFTVRKAFKTDPPSFDHAWYSYTQAELEHWERELRGIAADIRALRQDGGQPWPTNFKNCFQYGVNYACPFFEAACSKMKFQERPKLAEVSVSPERAQARLNGGPDLVVLSASSVETWLSCRERFRREYVEDLKMPAGEAVTLGKEFHEALGNYYKGMVKNES